VIEAQVLGHSHIHALRGALKALPPETRPHIEVMHMLAETNREHCVVTDTAGVQRLHPNVHAKLNRPDQHCLPVFSQIGGNVHQFFGLFEHPEPFDFILPDQPQLPCGAGALLLPYGYCARTLLTRMSGNFAALAALRNSVSGVVHHLESPPPVEDSAYCQASLPPVFREPAYQGLRVAAPVFRYKVWRLHSTVIRQECERLGIHFIPCPPESMDEHGFLRRPFMTEDPLHANELYGALVLKQILGRLQAEVPAVIGE
jgi:hypothetical protein